jgi:oxygen-independent coproporphyrinogen-3 oxidase
VTPEPIGKETGSLLLQRVARDCPATLALVTPQERITYAELAASASQLASSLRQAEIRPGEAVALWLPNGVAWLVGYWATVLGGYIAVPLSTRSKAGEIRDLVRHSHSAALLTTADFPNLEFEALFHGWKDQPSNLHVLIVKGAPMELPMPVVEWEEFVSASSLGGRPEKDQKLTVEDRRISLLQYTSGTTGRPKGACLTESGLLQAARTHADIWRIAPGEAVLVPNPFSHILGLMYGVLMPAVARATSLTLPVFDPEQTLRLAATGRAVAMTGAPTHFQMLAECPALEEADLSTLRIGLTGGATLSPEWARRVRDRLGLEILFNGYGMSEAGSVAQTGWDDSPEISVASVGHPMAGLEVKIVDPKSGQEQPSGSVGELQIRGESVMLGYLDDPVLTAQALDPEGWFRTGDLMRRDSDGRLYLDGRLKEMFTVGGFNVYPLAVERVLREHPSVGEAQVVGIPDERLGSVPAAFVLCDGNCANPTDLVEFCRTRLSDYMLPQRIEFVDEYPLTASGKIDKRALQMRVLPEPAFGNYFVSTYPPFSQWRDDAVDAFEERLGSESEALEPFILYVHVPFCAERCRFCYYLSSDSSGGEISTYVDSLLVEAELYRNSAALANRMPDILYFGGGTPSLLSLPRLERMFKGLKESFSTKAPREVTFECAPSSVTPDKARLLRALGVTRLSLGVQQMDDEVLSRSGRVHRVPDVEAAWRAIREAGFDFVNLDLMTGLVGETDKTFHRSLDRVIELDPESVTIYQMEIPLSTPLYRDIRGGRESEPAPWEEKHDRLLAGFRQLEEAGYQRVSSYTAVREPTKHKFLYQVEQYSGVDLIGLGASAFSYLGGAHLQNVTGVRAYIEALTAGRFPWGRAYSLSSDEQLIREFALQLKLGTLERSYFQKKFGIEITERFAEPLERFRARGWLEIGSSEIRLGEKGVARVDRMIPDFYQAQHRDVRYS